jgi:glycine oxidase
VRNPRHVKALLKACRQLGVETIDNCEATAIRQSGGFVKAVETSQGPRVADRYLVTGGAWSSGILSTAGIHIEIEPVRGQIVLLNCGQPLFRHVLEIGSRYLVPREDGRIIVGSTEERVGFVKENTAGGIAGLIEFARSLVPALDQTRVERCWAGLRPHTKRGTPYIGAVPACDNLFVAAGHFRAGLHLSTVTGRLAAQLVRGESPELALDAFAVT